MSDGLHEHRDDVDGTATGPLSGTPDQSRPDPPTEPQRSASLPEWPRRMTSGGETADEPTADARGVSRRRALAAAGAGLVASTAGCLSLLDDDSALTERRDERTAGTWRMHHGTASNGRTTTSTGPRTRPSVEWRRAVEGRGLLDPIVAESLAFETPLAGERATAIEVATGEPSAVPSIERGREIAIGTDDAGVYTARIGDEGSTVVARDPSGTGERWTTAVDARVPFETTVGDDRLYQATTSGGIESVSTADGTTPWRYDSPQPADSVATRGDSVTFTAAEYLFDVDRESGTRSWYRQLDAKTTTRPVRTSNGVVVGVDDGTVRRFDRDGSPTGTFDVGTGVVNGLLAVDDLLVATTSQHLVVHDPEGAERVRTLEDVGELVSLTAGADRVYAVDRDDPAIVAVDRDDHDVVWRRSLSMNVLGGPAVLDGTVLVRVGPLGADADQEQDPALVALT